MLARFFLTELALGIVGILVNQARLLPPSVSRTLTSWDAERRFSWAFCETERKHDSVDNPNELQRLYVPGPRQDS
jgi:hypothetical protein